jgi:hypothetical protein
LSRCARGVALAATAVLSIALMGCASVDQPSSSHTTVSLPTSSWRQGQASRLAEMEGVLEGSANDGCVWLMTGATKTPIVWPDGYVARFDPLEIVDDSGHVVARAGDHLRFSGGFAPVKNARCMLGQGNAFFVQSAVFVVPR